MENRFLERFGVRLPICSAGMAMIATPELVAAVSNAGGMGILGTGPIPPDGLRALIRDVRRRTANPFAVNLINESTAFGRLTTDDHVAVCVEEQVDLVVFFWQLPELGWIDSLQAAGIAFVVTAGTFDAIEKAVALPVSGLILQGEEAGGHVRSEAPLLDLLRRTRDDYPEALLVGAGGIANGEDVKGVLEAGADAVCLGTRFVASSEANAHPEYQRRIVLARGSETVVTEIFGPEWPGVPMRVIANAATRGESSGEIIGKTSLFGQPYDMPLNSAVLPMRETVGEFDMMCLAAGVSVERIRDVKTAEAIISELFDDWWH